MREHLGNDELIDEEQATNTPSDSTGWLDTTMDSVTDWLSGEDTDEQVNWEMVDPNFKTTVKDSDQHGESLLVLVNLDEAEVEKVRNELSVPTSSPFSSDYDTRYQYGFFITNPSDRAVTELKGVLNDYI